MRRLAFVVAVPLLAGCGNGSETSVTGATEVPTLPETAPATVPATSGPEETTGEAGDAETTTTVGEAADTAPDFTLELGSGGTFVLSEESRPVFMVFWAEW